MSLRADFYGALLDNQALRDLRDAVDIEPVGEPFGGGGGVGIDHGLCHALMDQHVARGDAVRAACFRGRPDAAGAREDSASADHPGRRRPVDRCRRASGRSAWDLRLDRYVERGARRVEDRDTMAAAPSRPSTQGVRSFT